jgi:fucose permease
VSSAPSQSTRPPASGEALAGFFLSGFLMALLGAILPAWNNSRYTPDFFAAGNYFLSLAIGIVVASLIARRVMERQGVAFLLVFSCILSSFCLGGLAIIPPTSTQWWRVAGLLILGIGAGLLNIALFHALSDRFQADTAGTVNRGGIWYGLGCLAATLLVAGTFYVYTVPSILIFMAVVPALFGGLYLRTSYHAPAPGTHPTLREAMSNVRSLGAVLFALLLFFQFGNEWSIAGWLPLFLMARIGVSASKALLILALYWAFLLTGRLIAVAVLPRMRHGRLLLGSGLSAMFGCFLLFSTNNAFGAGTGAFFVGAGYASVYPLVAEAIGRRFPYYHPGFFNGIFSFALVGGLVAPATLGYAAVRFGVGVVIGIPLLGTFLVMILLLLIWLESKVTGR